MCSSYVCACVLITEASSNSQQISLKYYSIISKGNSFIKKNTKIKPSHIVWEMITQLNLYFYREANKIFETNLYQSLNFFKPLLSTICKYTI